MQQEPGTAEAFGATVRVAQASGVGLCLVTVHHGCVDGPVRAVGGRMVMRLPGGDRGLALVTWEGWEALRAHPQVSLAGPVSIDPERFERFAALVGLDNPEKAPPAPGD